MVSEVSQIYLLSAMSLMLNARCTASPNDLDGPGGRRTRGLHDLLSAMFTSESLWREYGVDADVVVCSVFYFLNCISIIHKSVISCL